MGTTFKAACVQLNSGNDMQANIAHQTDLQGVLVEAVEGLEDLKACGAQGRFLKHYETATAQAAVSSSTV